MIKKLGQLNLNYSRLITYFESAVSGVDTTYVSPLHVSIQKQKFSENGYTKQQIKLWEEYNPESVMMQYLSGNELIKKYIEAKLDSSMLDEHLIDREIIRWNIQKQIPGRFTVPHYDLYHSVKTHTREQIVRLWIPLEDAKFGHALFVGDTVLADFKAGEIYDWDTDDLHAAVNAGFDPRYTLLLYFNKKNN
jgi:hypothetical protein